MLRKVLEDPAMNLLEMRHIELALNGIALKLSNSCKGKGGFALANQAARTVSDASMAAVSSSLSISPAM
jgi:hypothetical protein